MRPRKYFCATMFVAVCDQNFGNSTPFCSKTGLSLPGMKASRISHSISSNGSRPGIVKYRRTPRRRSGAETLFRSASSAIAGASSVRADAISSLHRICSPALEKRGVRRVVRSRTVPICRAFAPALEVRTARGAPLKAKEAVAASASFRRTGSKEVRCGHTRPSSFAHGSSSRRARIPLREGYGLRSAMQGGQAPLQASPKRFLEELRLVAEGVVDLGGLGIRRLGGGSPGRLRGRAHSVRSPRREGEIASPAARISSRSSCRRASPQRLTSSNWRRFTATIISCAPISPRALWPAEPPRARFRSSRGGRGPCHGGRSRPS